MARRVVARAPDNSADDMSLSASRVRRAAIALFAEKGFAGTSIREIAAHSGLSIATLYHYIPTKQHLLYDLMLDSIQRLVEAARQVAGEFDLPQEQIAGLTQLHVFSCALRRAQITVVDHELRSLTTAQRKTIVALRDEYEGVWAAAIAAGVEGGIFRISDATVLRIAILDLCSGPANWYNPGGRLQLEELATEYVRLVLGMLTGGGADPLAGKVIRPSSYYRELVRDTWPDTVDA
jgi:AcrR family transcriptional regulator